MNDRLKSQGKLHLMNDIESVCDQFLVSSFSNKIELMVPLPNFFILSVLLTWG